MAYSPAFLALAWHERGDRERAWEALRRAGDRTGPSDGERFWMISHAELLLADGLLTDEVRAIADALAATRPPETHPLWSPWRSLRARAAAGAGDRETASRLAGEELALARRSGAPWVVGRALRHARRADRRPGALREAVALLDGTSARLERAKAHAALGTPRRALELAERCGADGARPLAARVLSVPSSWAAWCRPSVAAMLPLGDGDRQRCLQPVRRGGHVRRIDVVGRVGFQVGDVEPARSAGRGRRGRSGCPSPGRGGRGR